MKDDQIPSQKKKGEDQIPPEKNDVKQCASINKNSEDWVRQKESSR